MNVLLDGKPLVPDQPGVSGAVQAAILATEGRGRVVVEVFGDGRPLSDDELQSATPALHELIDIRSAPVAWLLADTFAGAADRLAAAENLQRDAGHAIQAGNAEESVPKIQAAFECWQTAHGAVEQSLKLADLAGDATQQIVQKSGLAADALQPRTAALAQGLNGVKDAIGREDWSAISDLLLHDLHRECMAWQSLLREAEHRLRASEVG